MFLFSFQQLERPEDIAFMYPEIFKSCQCLYLEGKWPNETPFVCNVSSILTVNEKQLHILTGNSH